MIVVLVEESVPYAWSMVQQILRHHTHVQMLRRRGQQPRGEQRRMSGGQRRSTSSKRRTSWRGQLR